MHNMKPKVWNRHDYTNPPPANAVYIGRGSKWGNPFVIGEDGNRERVIRRHRFYVDRNPRLIREIKKELKDKDLVCFCAPAACHGDYLLWLANYTG